MRLILPLSVILPRKTKKDKKISLSLNYYRNAPFFESNTVKIKFKEYVVSEVTEKGIGILQLPLMFNYLYFFSRKSDVGNFHAVVEKFFLDALVEHGILPEDNCEVVKGGHYEFGGYDKINPRVEVSIYR